MWEVPGGCRDTEAGNLDEVLIRFSQLFQESAGIIYPY
jgi:hypothetical protein